MHVALTSLGIWLVSAWNFGRSVANLGVLGQYPHPTGWLKAFDLFFGLALVAISEEVIFRRYIRLAFRPYLGDGIFAVLTTSVLFGAYHWWAGLGNVLS